MLADDRLEPVIRRLFRQPDGAMAVFGEGPAAFPRDWQKSPTDRSTPFGQRLSLYEQELRDQLELLADQTREFEGIDLDRLEAEAMALLIALRELRRHFPELGE